jgi:hypothetical protein
MAQPILLSRSLHDELAPPVETGLPQMQAGMRNAAMMAGHNTELLAVISQYRQLFRVSDVTLCARIPHGLLADGRLLPRKPARARSGRLRETSAPRFQLATAC